MSDKIVTIGKTTWAWKADEECWVSTDPFAPEIDSETPLLDHCFRRISELEVGALRMNGEIAELHAERERDKYIEAIEQIFASIINYHMGLSPDEVIKEIELHPVLMAVAEWSIGGRIGKPKLQELSED